MKHRSSLLLFLLLIFVVFTAGCQENTTISTSIQNTQKLPELNLTVVSEKTEVKSGESFNIYLTLTNIGSNTLNVWEMYEQISYDISLISLENNSSVKYTCPVISRPALTNEFLVELKPSESLNSTSNSLCWNLDPGEYILSAVYHTGGGERISKTYWRGAVKSNEVLIKVVDTQSNLTASLV